MDSTTARAFIDRLWDHEIIPNLVDYIRIPNKSPAFDPDWQTHGYMDRAVEQFAAWARAKVSSIAGTSVEVVRLEGRTPVIFIDIPGQGGRHGAALWSPRQAAGDERLGRRPGTLGSRSSRTAGSMAEAAPTTAMRCLPPWRPSWR